MRVRAVRVLLLRPLQLRLAQIPWALVGLRRRAPADKESLFARPLVLCAARVNRDNSFDSRFYGPVARRRIVGQATAIVLSFDRQNYWVPRWHRFLRALDG